MKRVVFIIGGCLVVYLLSKYFKDNDCGCGCGGKKGTNTDSQKPVVNVLTDTKMELAKHDATPFTTNPAKNELRDTMIDAINMSGLAVSGSGSNGFQTTNNFFG